MKILERLALYKESDDLAMVSGTSRITYRQLWEKSEDLAAYIKGFCGEDKTPVVVYGHKNPLMLVAFLACVKSGRAYVPVDVSVPGDRVEAIIDSVQPRLILSTEMLEAYKTYPCLDLVNDSYENKEISIIPEEDYVKDRDVYYIIFTSGSTGTPKGVQISYESLNHFTEWALTLGGFSKEGKRFLNQAPFSFDLSVMDLYMSLASGSCLFSLEKETQAEYRKLFVALKESDANVWVSTPSFADLCLADDSFNQELLPDMELFLFCGELLTNKTAGALLERFPKAQVYNTYGPTESTVAVTEVRVDPQINKRYCPLPVGKSKPGTMIKIMDGNRELPDGEKGEVVIIGNTVSVGYFKNPKENEKKFFRYHDGKEDVPAYHTGDRGYIQDGQLFYCGRMDLQIKLHGYRMEIEDIEKNLMRVRGVEKALVVPVYDKDKVKYLKGFCVYTGEIENTLKTQKKIKEEMTQFVPGYMVPRKIIFVEEMPMTANGKIDRKKMQEIM